MPNPGPFRADGVFGQDKCSIAGKALTAIP